MRPAEYRAPRYVGLEAQASAAGTLGDVINRMTSFATKLGAQAAGQQAQEDYFSQYAITENDLKLAKDGDPSNVLIGNDTTIYGRTLKKMRAMELSGIFETEIKSLAAKLQTDAENGIPVDNVQAQLTAAIKQSVNILSQADPEAAIKLNAAGKMYASSAINAAYTANVKRQKETKQAAVTLSNQQENPELVSLTSAGISTSPEGAVNNIDYLDTRRTLRAHQSFAAGGQDFMDSEIKATDAVILAGAEQWVTNHVATATDVHKAYRQIRTGTTENATINAILTGQNAINGKPAPAWATAMAGKIRAAAKQAYVNSNAEQEGIEKAKERRAKLFEVDFAEALAAGDRTAMENALFSLKNTNPDSYIRRLEEYNVYTTGGSVFARYDNQSIVEILDRKFNDPYGDAVLLDDVYQVRNQLTQSTFQKYLGKVKSFDDEQVKLMKEFAASKLEMVAGPILGMAARAANARKEAQLAKLINGYMADRRMAARDPNFKMPSPFEWVERNYEKYSKEGGNNHDANLLSKIQAYPYKTEKQFVDAIRDLSKQRGADTRTLTDQLSVFREAMAAGLIDKDGKRLNK